MLRGKCRDWVQGMWCEWLDEVYLEGLIDFLSSQTAPDSFCRLHITITHGSLPNSSSDPTDHRSPSPVLPDSRRWHPRGRCPVVQAHQRRREQSPWASYLCAATSQPQGGSAKPDPALKSASLTSGQWRRPTKLWCRHWILTESVPYLNATYL